MSNVLTPLQRSDRTPAFFLWVAGVDVLYGSIMPPDRLYDIGASSGTYRKRAAIIPERGMNFRRRLEIEDHIIEASPVDVVLACDDQYDDSSTSADPANIFGRFGYEGSSFVYFAAGENILQSAATPITVEVVSDPTALFSVNDIVHIGREALRISAMDAVAKTITFDERGLLGTLPADHLSHAQTDTQPVITDRPVYFKGRRAIIFECDQVPDSTSDAWVERWRGFIPHEPEFGQDGAIHTLTIRVSPLTALLDVPLGDKFSKVTLETRYHTFGSDDDALAGTGLVGTVVDCYHEILPGDLFESGLGGDTINNAFPSFKDGDSCLVGVADECIDRHQDLVGPPFRGYVATYHPRALPMCHSGDKSTPLRVIDGFIDVDIGGGDTADVFDVSGYNAPDTSTAARFGGGVAGLSPAVKPEPGVPSRYARAVQTGARSAMNARAGYWRAVYLVDRTGHPSYALNPADEDWPQTYEWPRRLVEVINETGSDTNNFGWNVGHDEDYGAWLRIRLVNDTPEGSFFVIDNNMEGPIHVTFCNNNVPALQRTRADNLPTPQCGFRRMRSEPTGLLLGHRNTPGERMDAEVLRLGTDEGDPETIRVEASDAGITYSTRIAEAFYQAGEGYLLTSDLVRVPAGGFVMLEASQGDELLNTFKITECTTITVDGNTLYRCKVANRYQAGDRALGPLKTMAQYYGDEPIELAYAATFATQNIGEICLQLLTSQGGNGIGGAYDKLSHGAGLLDSSSSHLGTQGASYINGSVDVDAASFLQIDNPIPNAVYRPVWRNGQTVYEVLAGILRCAGYVIDIRTDERGRCRLAAVPLGFPSRTNIIGTLTEADIADAPHPRSPAQLDIFNAYLFKYNHDESDEAQGEQKVRDQVSIDTFGAEEVLDVELPGVHLSDELDIIHQLRPMYQRLRFDLSYPRRLWSFEARGGLAVAAEIGGSYSVTHQLLRPHQGLGVTDQLARLREVSHIGWQPTCKLEFVYYGTEGSGWAPALEVTDVPTATTIVVAENTNTGETHPRSGADIEDLTAFDIGAAVYLQSGATVLVYPAGDMDNVTSLTIQSVSTTTNTVTFTAAHGLPLASQDHVVVPMASSLGTVAAGFENYAYIGDVVLS